MKRLFQNVFLVALLIISSICFSLTTVYSQETNAAVPEIERVLSGLRLDARIERGVDDQLSIDISISNTGDQAIELETLAFRYPRIGLMIKSSKKDSFPRNASLVLEQPDLVSVTIDGEPINLLSATVVQLPPRSSLQLSIELYKFFVTMKDELQKFGIDESDWISSIIKAKVQFDSLVDIQTTSGKRLHGGIASQWLSLDEVK